ncbi:MAG TPA: hydroxyisourate hydrolase [Bryobacteraceae bacterium]|jgi:5-hydroxyisourate hydrolase
MARISTHVLDTAKGVPASGIPIELHFDGELVGSATTNSDGRTDEPLLTSECIPAGHYELIFHVERYLGVEPFFDRISIRFAVCRERENYHVPLLLAPHGYSTYRGS